MYMDRTTDRAGRAPNRHAVVPHTSSSRSSSPAADPTTAAVAQATDAAAASHSPTRRTSARSRSRPGRRSPSARSKRVDETTQTALDASGLAQRSESRRNSMQTDVTTVNVTSQAHETSYENGAHPDDFPSAMPSTSMNNSMTNISSGAARIGDLHPSEKSKIGKLLQELVVLKREAEKKEQATRELEIQMAEQRRRHEQQEAEKETIRREFEITQAQLRMLESKTSASAAPAPFTSTKPKQVASDSISRLHVLGERVRAAATGSPYTGSLNAGSSPQTATQSSGTAASAVGGRPFSSVLSSLASSPYRAPLSIPTSNNVSFLGGAFGYNTDDERPRSTVPQPSLSSSLRSSPSRPLEPTYHPYQPPVPQTALHEIKQVLREVQERERQASLSPTRRRLDLHESGSNTAESDIDQPRQQSTRGSPTRDLPVIHSTVIHGMRQPTKVDFLPPAVSGVTRVLAAAPSPDRNARQPAQPQPQPKAQRETHNPEEALERRARELAKEMYERKLEEEERKVSSASNLAGTTRTGSSLSSYFNAHPLTSQLSPMQPLRRRYARERSSSPSSDPHIDPPKPRSGRKKQRTPKKDQQEERKDYSQPPVASGVAAEMLNKSMQIASEYASQRRARSASQTAPGTSLADSTRSTADPLAQSIRVPDSPYSLTSSSSVDPTAMTPTSRKIHRLLSIQNPSLANEQRERQMKEREDREAREEKKRVEMQDKRRRELEQAEARAKQAAERMAQSIAATRAATDAAARDHSQAIARHLPLPIAAQPRPKTPVETYVPPPFSYRNPSRTSQRPEEKERTVESPSKRGGGGSSVANTPGSVSESHRNTHTSFLSPFPTHRSATASAPHTGNTVMSDHDAEDAEILSMFQVRSPSSLQMAVEEEMEQAMRRDRQEEARSATKAQYAQNFASDMLAAAGTPVPSERVAYGNSGAAPFAYSSAYPFSRLDGARPSAPAASNRETSTERARALLQSKIETLHLLQLERDLESVMPQVLQGLTDSRTGTPAQRSVHATPRRPPSALDQQATSRLSQPSSPIVKITRRQRDERYPRLTETQDGGKHSASPRKKTFSRYSVHADGYSARRRSALQQQGSVPSSAVSSMPASEVDEFGECLDIIDRLHE